MKEAISRDDFENFSSFQIRFMIHFRLQSNQNALFLIHKVLENYDAFSSDMQQKSIAYVA